MQYFLGKILKVKLYFFSIKYKREKKIPPFLLQDQKQIFQNVFHLLSRILHRFLGSKFIYFLSLMLHVYPEPSSFLFPTDTSHIPPSNQFLLTTQSFLPNSSYPNLSTQSFLSNPSFPILSTQPFYPILPTQLFLPKPSYPILHT